MVISMITEMEKDLMFDEVRRRFERMGMPIAMSRAAYRCETLQQLARVVFEHGASNLSESFWTSNPKFLGMVEFIYDGWMDSMLNALENMTGE